MTTPPEDNYFTAYNPPTTLAAVDKCSFSLLSCVAAVSSSSGFLIAPFPDKVASLPLWSGRKMKHYHSLFKT